MRACSHRWGVSELLRLCCRDALGALHLPADCTGRPPRVEESLRAAGGGRRIQGVFSAQPRHALLVRVRVGGWGFIRYCMI